MALEDVMAQVLNEWDGPVLLPVPSKAVRKHPSNPK
jgi:hypothetical protein